MNEHGSCGLRCPTSDMPDGHTRTPLWKLVASRRESPCVGVGWGVGGGGALRRRPPSLCYPPSRLVPGTPSRACAHRFFAVLKLGGVLAQAWIIIMHHALQQRWGVHPNEDPGSTPPCSVVATGAPGGLAACRAGQGTAVVMAAAAASPGSRFSLAACGARSGTCGNVKEALPGCLAARRSVCNHPRHLCPAQCLPSAPCRSVPPASSALQ